MAVALKCATVVAVTARPFTLVRVAVIATIRQMCTIPVVSVLVAVRVARNRARALVAVTATTKIVLVTARRAIPVAVLMSAIPAHTATLLRSVAPATLTII
jgi:hypothetical protein